MVVSGDYNGFAQCRWTEIILIRRQKPPAPVMYYSGIIISGGAYIMPSIVSSDFNSPDETMTFDKAEAKIANLADVRVTQAILQPGWSWSTCIKPVVGTESC